MEEDLAGVAVEEVKVVVVKEVVVVMVAVVEVKVKDPLWETHLLSWLLQLHRLQMGKNFEKAPHLSLMAIAIK